MIWWKSFLLGLVSGMGFLIVLAIIAAVLDGKRTKRRVKK